jgi:hypothetical protein
MLNVFFSITVNPYLVYALARAFPLQLSAHVSQPLSVEVVGLFSRLREIEVCTIL